MKNKFLVSLIAFLAVVAFVAAVNASDLSVDINEIEVNGIDILSGSVVAGIAGEVIPVNVMFTAYTDAGDVQVSTWIQGHRSDSTQIDFADLVSDKSYNARLALVLPTDIDPQEDMTLFVRIESDNGNWEDSYTVSMQRKPYSADVIFVDVDSNVKAGTAIPIDVVVKNMGRHDLSDLVVTASIAKLGISKSAYFGDLTPIDNNTDDNNNNVDSAERKLYLTLPSNVAAGTYDLEIRAYNKKVNSIIKKIVTVVGNDQESEVVVPITSREVSVGNTETYDLVIVNSGNKVGVYEIVSQTSDLVSVSTDTSIITVSAGSSEIVKLKVEGLKKGAGSFAVDINSEGKLVKRVMLTANVSEKAFGSNVIILTIILAIVFIVLLVVLIVLLTRKPARSELEESYY